MSAPLTVESLAEMFPHYGLNVIRDVATQCDNNNELALEKLLELQAESSAQDAAPAPPPAALQTQQVVLSTLFPAERGRGPGRAEHPAADRTVDSSTQLADLVHELLPPSSLSRSAPPLTSVNHQDSLDIQDLFPGLAMLDTGQQPSSLTAGVPAAPAPRMSIATWHAGTISRGWWPSWPCTRTVTSGQLPMSPRSVSLGACTASGMPLMQCVPASTASNGSTRLATPPRTVPAAFTVPTDQWDEDGSRLGVSPFGSPPQATPGAASGSANPNGTPPSTQLLSQHDSLCPASGPVRSPAASSPCSDDEVLAALMPHLAHCLASPSLSGTTSPMREVAQRQGSEQQGYGAAELVAAVEFYLQMFPNLKREVVGDVLQRYSHEPQAGLDQLIMLSSCVENATADAEGGSSTAVPDMAGWESLSSGSDEEEGTGSCHRGSQAAPGTSWDAGLTSEELAGMANGIFPSGVLPTDAAQQAQQPVQQPAAAGGWERPLSPEGEDELLPEEKEELLRAEFKSIAQEEVSAALAACDGSLFAAAELLQSFAAEDAVSSSSVVGGGLNGGTHSAAAAAASVPAAAAPVPLGPASTGSSCLPQHVRPKVQHLARRFPEVPTEALEVALASCSYDLATARRTLREAGYTEAQVEPSPANMRQLTAPPNAAAAAALAVPRPIALAPASTGIATAAASQVPAPAGLSLSEATYLRNQSIWEQERAQAQRLEQCYRRCFELAAEAHARGDHAAAADLSMRGRQYRHQFFEEQSKASRRISKRVNSANGLPHIKVDLHGQTVAEALATVESGIRNLPESIPGGVVVRYITGKGLHSTGGAARIKPEVVRLLSERGIPFVEAPNGGGWVEATLVPAA